MSKEAKSCDVFQKPLAEMSNLNAIKKSFSLLPIKTMNIRLNCKHLIMRFQYISRRSAVKSEIHGLLLHHSLLVHHRQIVKLNGRE